MAIEEAQRLAAEKAIIVPLFEGTETVIASMEISGSLTHSSASVASASDCLRCG